MKTADPDDFEAIPLGGLGKLVNPQAGFAFGFCGADAQASPVRVPPKFASAETAGEMVELYWATLARDVPFDGYATDPTIAAACAELSALSDFRGPKIGGAVTPGTDLPGPDGRRSDRALHLAAAVEAGQLRACTWSTSASASHLRPRRIKTPTTSGTTWSG